MKVFPSISCIGNLVETAMAHVFCDGRVKIIKISGIIDNPLQVDFRITYPMWVIIWVTFFFHNEYLRTKNKRSFIKISLQVSVDFLNYLVNYNF